MAGEGLLSYLETDGKSVDYTATAAVAKGQVAVVGVSKYWLGIANRDAAIGDKFSISVDERVYQFTVPSGLGAVFGSTLYLDLALVTGHTPQSGAWSLSSGGTKVAFAKCVEDQSGQVVSAKLLPPTY